MSSQGGFDNVVQNIDLMLDDQNQKIMISLEKTRDCHILEVEDNPMFAMVLYKISNTCMEYLIENHKKALEGQYDSECHDWYWRYTYGIPCVHEFANAIQAGRPITLQEIHRFWRQIRWDRVNVEDDEGLQPTPISLGTQISLVCYIYYFHYLQIVITSNDISIGDILCTQMHKDHSEGKLSQDQIENMGRYYQNMRNPGCSMLKEPDAILQKKGRPKKSTTRDIVEINNQRHCGYLTS